MHVSYGGDSESVSPPVNFHCDQIKKCWETVGRTGGNERGRLLLTINIYLHTVNLLIMDN